MIATTLLCASQIAYGSSNNTMSIEELNYKISSVQLEIENCESDMEHAHNMAESARNLDIEENHSIIETAKDIYFEASSKRKELVNELNTLKVQKQRAEEIVKQSMVYVGNFKLTGYCPCNTCSEGYGYQTSSGVTAIEGITVAADRNIIPQGTKVYIEGVGERTVQDVGGAIRGNKLDIFVNNHSDCYKPQYNQTSTKVYIIN